MSWIFYGWLFLAEAPAAKVGEQQAEPPPAIFSYMPLILIMVLGYFLILRPQARQASQLRDRVSKLKKGDRLVTKAGIFGSVVSVDAEQNRLTVKIDEATNTKIDITLNSVDYVLEEKTKPVD